MDLQVIQSKIYNIRGYKVMLDFDLAELYQVETKFLKRAVKRNIERFPEDFMLTLTEKEFANLRCQIGPQVGEVLDTSHLLSRKKA